MSIVVKDGNGASQTIQTLPGVGQAAGASSLPVVLASDSNHATAGNITSLSTAITGALAPVGGLPVSMSGTVAVTQSGTWTVALAANATVALAGGNTVALKVDGSAVTQPVSGTVVVGSLPALPTGTNAIGSVNVSNFPATQAISAAALPLPALAAKDTTVAAITTALGSPLQAGGNVAVTALPALPAGANAIGSVLSDLRVGGAAVASGNPIPADTVVRAASADRGGTITAGGTAQQFMAANATRRGFVVQNQSSADLYINLLGTAVIGPSSLKIPAGALYETSTHHAGTGAGSIIGATTGQAFYSREF